MGEGKTVSTSLSIGAKGDFALQRVEKETPLDHGNMACPAFYGIQ
jgi:hypothetical protein